MEVLRTMVICQSLLETNRVICQARGLYHGDAACAMDCVSSGEVPTSLSLL